VLPLMVRASPSDIAAAGSLALMVGNEGMMAFSTFRREHAQLSATDAPGQSLATD
jgi:hypothetical protein